MIKDFTIGKLYSNEDISKALKVANAGGIRLSIKKNAVIRAAIMTCLQDFYATGENPYRDRLEKDILTYTAAGKVGEQTLSGVNNRILDQKNKYFPIHGFVLIASRRDKSIGPKRWKYLGLLEYRRLYPDIQLDSEEKVRRVWIFEFKIHQEPKIIPIQTDGNISNQTILQSKNQNNDTPDSEIINECEQGKIHNFKQIEKIRGNLLLMDPKKFEFFIKDLLIHTGFTDVYVTKFSSDGGIDINAKASEKMWIFENSIVQIQAKRWLHSVGRKEVAELRGSLKPFTKGALITTSHFSKAALNEANEEGKNPISLIDGFRLSKVIFNEKFFIQ